MADIVNLRQYNKLPKNFTESTLVICNYQISVIGAYIFCDLTIVTVHAKCQ